MNSDVSMPIFVQILLYISAGIVSISASSAIIVKILKKATTSLTRASIEESIKNGTSEIAENVAVVGCKIDDYISRYDEDMATVRKTLQDNTRYIIQKIYKESINMGYISDHDMYIVNELYTDYENLDGNSFICSHVEDLRDLYRECQSQGSD